METETNIILIPMITGFLSAGAIFSIWLGLQNRKQPDTLGERLTALQGHRKAIHQIEMEQSFMVRVVQPMIRQWMRRLGRFMPNRNIETIQLKLERAGRPHNLTISDFLGLRILAAIVAAAVTLIFLQISGMGILRSLIMGLGAGLIGSFIPVFWLNKLGKARQEEIQRGLPDALDMLTISVTAGLGLDSAMQVISEKWDNAVAEEFAKTVREMQIGVPRSEALRAMSRRNDVKEMSNFIAVLVQADQLGLTISHVLKTQADQMRLMRRQRAEEQASKAPIKMLFPLVFLIFPAIFAVVLGPAVPRMASLFETL